MTRCEIAPFTVFKCRYYYTYSEAARRVLDFIDDDREAIIRFLGNGILLPAAVCIRSNNNLEPSFVVRAYVMFNHHPRLPFTIISLSSDISVSIEAM